MIPILSSVLFRLGGWGKDDDFCPGLSLGKKGGAKWIRWAMGVPIGIIAALTKQTYIPLLCGITYLIATNVINYGESQIWRKWFGRNGAWAFYGFCFGLASIPALGWLSLPQAFISCGVFLTLMLASNDGIKGWYLNHAWVELGIGLGGTLCYLIH